MAQHTGKIGEFAVSVVRVKSNLIVEKTFKCVRSAIYVHYILNWPACVDARVLEILSNYCSRPNALNLQHRVHSDIAVGYLPRLDLQTIHFPSLRSLTLGHYSLLTIMKLIGYFHMAISVPSSWITASSFFKLRLRLAIGWMQMSSK